VSRQTLTTILNASNVTKMNQTHFSSSLRMKVSVFLTALRLLTATTRTILSLISVFVRKTTTRLMTSLAFHVLSRTVKNAMEINARNATTLYSITKLETTFPIFFIQTASDALKKSCLTVSTNNQDLPSEKDSMNATDVSLDMSGKESLTLVFLALQFPALNPVCVLPVQEPFPTMTSA